MTPTALTSGKYAESLVPLLRPIESVTRDENNINTHTDYDLSEIAKSLERFGQQTPIVVTPAAVILKGNGTHQAAVEKLGWTEIAVSVYDSESPTDQLLYAIADNASGRLSKFDQQALAHILAEHEFVPGIATDERERLLNLEREREAKERASAFARLLGENNSEESEGEIENAVPEVDSVVENVVRVQLGEIWQLGHHRLFCGSSTDEAAVARLFEGMLARAVITDPPYGVDIVEKNEYLNELQPANRNLTRLENDTMSGQELETLIRDALTVGATHSVPGATAFVFSPQGENLENFIAAFRGSGFKFKWQGVWNKLRINFGRADWHFQHENILYGWKHDAGHFHRGHRSSVYDYPKPARNKEHATMKPLELMHEAVERLTEPGELVFDPFGGSGTTLLACEDRARVCVTCELLPVNAVVIIERWELLTGKTAILLQNTAQSSDTEKCV